MGAATDRLVAIVSPVLLSRAVELETKGLDHEIVAKVLTEPSTIRLALAALAAPANRPALVAWLTAAGVIVEAGVWDRPEVDEAAMNEAKDRYYRENDQRLADEAAGRPWSDDEVDAMIARSNEWHDRRRILDGPTVYFEGGDIPEGAPPLYRIGGR